jgi:hypothetical protein
VEPDDELGRQIAERLPDETENRRGQCGHAHNDREVGEHLLDRESYRHSGELAQTRG